MSKDIIATTAQSEGFPRVSIYIPTYVRGNEIEQNGIRLKNAVFEARDQLDAAGIDPAVIEQLLAEATSRIDDHVYWRYQKEGLAVLIEDGLTRFIKLPGVPPELCVVAERYHIRPLVRLLRDGELSHVLAVTRDGARLFDARRHDMTEVHVEDMPESIEAVRGMTDFEDNVGYHQRSAVGPRGDTGVPSYNAQGESADDYEEVVLEHYLRDVAKAVDHHLAGQGSRATLVLAAGPRILGRLRGFLDYADVADEAVQKDPQSLSDKELHEAARAIAEARDKDTSPRGRARADLARSLQGAPDTASGRTFEDILAACAAGRVETLFVSEDETIWGRIDPASGVTHIGGGNTPETEDLVNLLCLRVLAQGGDVFTMPEDAREKAGPMIALYRY